MLSNGQNLGSEKPDSPKAKTLQLALESDPTDSLKCQKICQPSTQKPKLTELNFA